MKKVKFAFEDLEVWQKAVKTIQLRQLQKSLFCHPERSEGSYNLLILQDSSLRSE